MYYYNNELPPQQGWICPKCGRVNAPWLPTCGCVSSQTSGTPYLVKTSSISRDSHEIAKTENCSEKPNNCATCKWGEWYRKGYDITMMSDECGGCCSWNNKWTPKDEPQTETQNSNLIFEKDECAKEYEELGLRKLKELRKDESQTEEWHTWQDEQEYNDRWQADRE